MVEGNHLKELAAKLDNMQAIMEQPKERLMAAIDQHDDRVKMLEMSLQSISKFIETQIVATTVSLMEASQTMRGE